MRLSTPLTKQLTNALLERFQASSVPLRHASQRFMSSTATTAFDSVNITDTQQQYTALLNRCMGNVQQAERLIQYETRRKAGISRDDATRFAILRWEKDNR